MSVFHDSPGNSLTVIVSKDFDILVKDWAKTIYPDIGGFVILACATLYFAALSGRRQNKLITANEVIVSRELELMTIIQTEPECVKQLDADANLLFMNRAGLEMIDADDLEQVKGQNVLPIVLPESRDAFMELTRQVFEGKSGTLEFEIQGLKGSRRTLETHAVPLKDAGGNIRSLLGITRDITERKRAEREREEALGRIRTLEGILPICASCKKIRDANKEWKPVEQYVTEHTKAEFSHGICPDCLKKLYPDFVNE